MSSTSNSERESTLVSNEVYDVIRATAAKLEGLAAYEKYARDGNGQLWEQLQRQDEQAVGQLLQQLSQLGEQGKLQTTTGNGDGRSSQTAAAGRQGTSGGQMAGHQASSGGQMAGHQASSGGQMAGHQASSDGQMAMVGGEQGSPQTPPA